MRYNDDIFRLSIVQLSLQAIDRKIFKERKYNGVGHTQILQWNAIFAICFGRIYMTRWTVELLSVGHQDFISPSEKTSLDDTGNSSINLYNL